MSFLPFDEQDDDLVVRDFSVARHDEVGRDAPVRTLERAEPFGLENCGSVANALGRGVREITSSRRGDSERPGFALGVMRFICCSPPPLGG